ncbi:general secretion pathway protein F [gamma proteobacterium HTCC5015]|nr:general secretion pathway protein F [gamma proteobacterium HTCC5015]
MKRFHYTVLRADGTRDQGEILAPSRGQARRQLNCDGAFLIRLKAPRSHAVSRRQWRQSWPLVVRQLRQLSAAGVPLAEAMDALSQEAEPVAWAQLLQDLARDLSAGQRLSQALARFEEHLPEPSMSLIQAGENSGTLERQLDTLAQILEWREARRSEAINALFYPAVAALATLAAAGFLLLYLVPKLAPFLRELGVDLPFYSRFLFAFSDWLLLYGLWLLPLLPLLFSALWISSVWRFLPGVGKVLHELSLSQFSAQMRVLYAAGMALPRALERAGALLVDRRGAVGVAAQALESGQSLSQALQSTRQFSPLFLRVVRVGEHSGGLEESFAQLEVYHSERAQRRLQKLQAMLAPSVSVMLALLLLWIVAAVFLPLYDAMEVMV